MSLTSSTFIWGLRALLLLSVLWVVWRWPAAAGRGVLSVIRRVLSLVVVMVLASLNLVAPINAQYGWYETFSDVVADVRNDPGVVPAAKPRGQTPQQAVDQVPAPSPFAGLPTSARANTRLSLTPIDSGGYQAFTVPGPSSGYTGQVTVWVPPSYTQADNAHREYPVLEALHGFLPSILGFFTVYHLDTVMAQAVAQHQMRDAIIVIPAWAPNKLDTECVNGSVGQIQMEDWLTKDVPAWVYEHFRVAPDRQSWATIGASAGGWCALMATMLHPATYATAISLGGYAKPDFDPSYVPFTANSPQGRRYDLVSLAAQAPPPVALWVLSSTPDHLSYPQSAALTSGARAPLSATMTTLTSGSHRSAVWDPYFPTALAWLGSVSKGFAPL